MTTPTELAGALMWRAFRTLVDSLAKKLAERGELHLLVHITKDADGVHVDWEPAS